MPAAHEVSDLLKHALRTPRERLRLPASPDVACVALAGRMPAVRGSRNMAENWFIREAVGGWLQTANHPQFDKQANTAQQAARR